MESRSPHVFGCLVLVVVGSEFVNNNSLWVMSTKFKKDFSRVATANDRDKKEGANGNSPNDVNVSMVNVSFFDWLRRMCPSQETSWYGLYFRLGLIQNVGISVLCLLVFIVSWDGSPELSMGSFHIMTLIAPSEIAKQVLAMLDIRGNACGWEVVGDYGRVGYCRRREGWDQDEEK